MVQTFPVPRTGVTGVLVGQPHNMSALGVSFKLLLFTF